MINYLLAGLILIGIIIGIAIPIILLVKNTSCKNKVSKRKSSTKLTYTTTKVENDSDKDIINKCWTELNNRLNDLITEASDSYDELVENDDLTPYSPLLFGTSNTANGDYSIAYGTKNKSSIKNYNLSSPEYNWGKHPEFIKRNILFQPNLVQIRVDKMTTLGRYNNDYSIGDIAYIEDLNELYIKINDDDWERYDEPNYLRLLEECDTLNKNKEKEENES